MSLKRDLDEKGWAIVKSVLTPGEASYVYEMYHEWMESVPQLMGVARHHGIFKTGEAGNQYHSWFVRTHPNVQRQFTEIYGTTEFTTGFDGSCYFSKEEVTRGDPNWTHSDQAPSKPGFECVQSFVSLTKNEHRCLRVYEGSHKLHEQYMKDRGLDVGETKTKNWHKIDLDFLETIQDSMRVIHVEPGDMVFWDSRTFHQNQVGEGGEERIVLYICLQPKHHPKNTAAMQAKRLKYFHERRTTSHWAYPLQVNGLQGQTYGDPTQTVDYSLLPKPDLTFLMPQIMKLL